MAALLSSTAMKIKPAHGGGLSPVVAGQLHTPAVDIEETFFTDTMKVTAKKELVLLIFINVQSHHYA